MASKQGAIASSIYFSISNFFPENFCLTIGNLDEVAVHSQYILCELIFTVSVDRRARVTGRALCVWSRGVLHVGDVPRVVSSWSGGHHTTSSVRSSDCRPVYYVRVRTRARLLRRRDLTRPGRVQQRRLASELLTTGRHGGRHRPAVRQGLQVVPGHRTRLRHRYEHTTLLALSNGVGRHS